MIGIVNSYIFNYVPEGLIVPYYTAAAVPSGWDLFSSADGKHIVGADSGDSDYSVGSHSGLNLTTDVTSSETGDHLGTGIDVDYGGRAAKLTDPKALLIWRRALTESAALGGNHSHTITFTPTLGYETMRFIKALEVQNQFPAGAIILSDSIIAPPAGITQQIVVADPANNRFLKANTAIATAYNTLVAACSTDGDHHHGWVQYANTAFQRGEPGSVEQLRIATGDTPPGFSSGDHPHTFASSTMTENMSKVYLAAWTNAAASFQGCSKMIAMWESFTPPSGWVLCDGNNGTKDLTKRFIMFGPNSSVGQYAGNGKLTFSATLNQADFLHEGVSHSHMHTDDMLESEVEGTYTNVNHDTEEVLHNHTVTTTEVEHLPNYYSLVFIQKL